MLAVPYKERLEEIFSQRKNSLCGLRSRAWKRAWEIGVPDIKSEPFRKVLLTPLYERKFVEKKIELLDVAPYIRSDMHQVVFINGRFCPHLSSVNALKPCVVLPIEEAFLRYGIFLQNRIHYNIKNETNFFSLLTEALQDSGLFIYVPPNTKIEKPIQLIQLYSGEKCYASPRIQVMVGSSSELKVFSEQIFLSNDAIVNALFDVVVEQNAKCEVEELSLQSADHIIMQHVRATLRRDSSFSHFFATNGSKLYRQDINVELLESGSSTNLKGVWNLNSDRKVHTQILVSHKAPSALSNQHYKGVLKDKSVSTFEGKIYVDPIAQKTESYQLNNNLILEQGARAFSKPNLEIFADDVKATHGATIAELSEEELFYMRTRGLKAVEAKEILVKGFLDALLKELSNSQIREAFNAL